MPPIINGKQQLMTLNWIDDLLHPINCNMYGLLYGLTRYFFNCDSSRLLDKWGKKLMDIKSHTICHMI